MLERQGYAVQIRRLRAKLRPAVRQEAPHRAKQCLAKQCLPGTGGIAVIRAERGSGCLGTNVAKVTKLSAE